MTVLKVHGSVISSNVMRVLACLYKKELVFEFVHVDLAAGEHKKEHFLSLNPFGQVPAFQDGESRAITRYISKEYAGNATELLHDGKNTIAHECVGLEVEAHQFNPPASTLAREIVFKPMFGMTTDETVVKEQEAILTKILDLYENRLSKSKYLAGEEFSLVDLHHIPTMYYLLKTPVKKLFELHPHANAWCTTIMARPAWLKVVELQKKKKNLNKRLLV